MPTITHVGDQFIVSDIFATELDPPMHCEAELIPPAWRQTDPWLFDIEVNANRKLAPL